MTGETPCERQPTAAADFLLFYAAKLRKIFFSGKFCKNSAAATAGLQD